MQQADLPANGRSDVALKDVPRDEIADTACAVFRHIRARAPRVHCITNNVAQHFTANVLLAAGAIPSMTTAREEIAAFTEHCDALLVNLGTMDDERRTAIALALDVTTRMRKPWLLDPVFIERSKLRCDFAQDLLARKPAAIRLNAAELAALVPQADESGRAASLNAQTGAIVAQTGAVDTILGAGRVARIMNGHPLMAKVTAMGCAASALATAAFAVESDAFRAITGALALFGVAGEIAGARAQGPGTFAVHMLDALHGLNDDAIHTRIKIA
jgi:hydroxyethylthiazole kinase